MNTHVPSCPSQTFMLAERYMLLRRQVNEFFSETKVNNMYGVLLPVAVTADKKVLRLYVSVDEIFRMNVFYA